MKIPFRIDEFKARLEKAASGLDTARRTYWEGSERARVAGKAEGVRLAISYLREYEEGFALSEFQQQVARNVLVTHRDNGSSFCADYGKGCKFRAPFGSTPQMRESFAQHQIDEIIKALS